MHFAGAMLAFCSRHAKKYFHAMPELFSRSRADLTENVPGRESARF